MMSLASFCVRRPVFAAVGAIIVCVIGLAAFFALPVRELPSVDPPQVSIRTSYRGASAEVVEQRITEVIERQVSGVQGIDRITSTSRDGSSNISITFLLDRDLEEAANDVRDATSRVTAQLPDQADPPQVIKANADASPIMILRLRSKTMERRELADYATRNLVERLSTVPGVATVQMQGAQLYAMRIWLNPDAMAARGITVDDIQSSLAAENLELPAGSLESSDTDFTVRVKRKYTTAKEFENLPITSSGGQSTVSTAGAIGASAYVTRLGDVARIEEGVDERRKFFRSDGQEQISLSLTRQSVANDLEISKNVRAELKTVNAGLPKGTTLDVGTDNSRFTSDALHEVWITMGLSLALVALVNFVFLGSARAALVPTIVAPICILGAFIPLALLGYSLNLLTLLALVLSIGLVVDDAIVVVENIQRRIDEEGEPPPVAAERGANEVFFAVIATTIVLISVFAPLMFLPGYIGRLFVELAVTVAASVFASAIMALSLSPMLASKLLRTAHNEGWLAEKVTGVVNSVRRSYQHSLQMMLGGKFTAPVVGGGVVVLGAVAALLFATLPQELVPNEDRGMVNLQISAPEGAGFDYTMGVVDQLEPMLKDLVKRGVAESYYLQIPGFGGASSFNNGAGGLNLVPWDKRKEDANQVATELTRQTSAITRARIIAGVPSPFQRGGGGSSNTVQFIAEGDNYDSINLWLQPIYQAALNNPNFQRVRLDYEPTSPRVLVDIDREKAASLGVPVRVVGSALQTMMGSVKSTTYVKNGLEYDVILQTDRDRRQVDNDINNLYVRARSGELIPLASVVKTETRGDTPDRKRVDRLRAISLSAGMGPDYTVKDGIDFFKAEAAKYPSNISIGWGGAAKDLMDASNAIYLAFGMALLLVFLVLAAQFESWIHPAVIMLTVPLAALGGLFGLLMAGSTINTYSEIGLIILIGIAAKNGILIVEFANQLRDRGLEVREAVIESASLRLRPIVMTSVSAAFGAMPLMFWPGPGAGSRSTIGVTIFTGSIFATLLTLFVVPVFYDLLARYTKSPDWMAKQIEAYDEQGEAGGHPAPAE
jgi:multidrug efflux pump